MYYMFARAYYYGDRQPLLSANSSSLSSFTVQQNIYLYNFRYTEFTQSITFSLKPIQLAQSKLPPL